VHFHSACLPERRWVSCRRSARRPGELVGVHVALVEDRADLPLLEQVVGHVAAGVEVVVEAGAGVPRVHVEGVVVVDDGVLPELAAGVVVVAGHGVPGVLVDEHHALAEGWR
jgi:hypothetical protein